MRAAFRREGLLSKDMMIFISFKHIISFHHVLCSTGKAFVVRRRLPLFSAAFLRR